jgi:hypothetical protein
VELRREVLRHEDDGYRAADLLVVVRSRARLDQRQHGAAIRRRDRDPTLAGLEADILRELEPELIDVKAQAPLLVADEDLDRVQAQITEQVSQFGRVVQASYYRARAAFRRCELQTWWAQRTLRQDGRSAMGSGNWWA